MIHIAYMHEQPQPGPAGDISAACMRQGGWNNPSAAQFRLAYRKAVVHAAVFASQKANVMPQLEGTASTKGQSSRTEDICAKDTPPKEDEVLDTDHTEHILQQSSA